MRELDELTDLAASLNDAPSFSRTVERLVEWAKGSTGAASVFLRLNEEAADGSVWAPACRRGGSSTSFDRDEALVSAAECICGHVATGNVVREDPFFTERGSFVSPDLASFMSRSSAGLVGPLRGRCAEEGFRSLAVVPLQGPDGPIGCLHLADPRPDLFSERLEMIEAVCRMAGRMLLHHQARERQEAVLETIQWALLPPQAPEVTGLRLGLCFVSATDLASIGGDFYDVIDRGSDGAVLFTGDYSGHGIQAAAVASHARLVLSSIARRVGGPSEVLAEANSRLLEDVPEEHFVSAAVCAVDTRTGVLRLALAGHPAPILVRAGEAAEVPMPFNRPLGLDPDVVFREAEITLEDGDALIMVTDGILESRRRGRLFGVEGIDDVVRAAGTGTLSELCAAICDASDRYHDKSLPSDDRLALAVMLSRR